MDHFIALESELAGGLMCWDYLFGTCRAQPKTPHEKMDIGLQDCSVKYASSLGRMLLEPFFKQRVERTK